jgi:peroxiredoxin
MKKRTVIKLVAAGFLSVVLAGSIGCAGVQQQGGGEGGGAVSAGGKTGDKQVVGDFVLRDLKGKRVQFRDFNGKVVLISFWATWCEPCKHELPRLQEIWQRLQDKGFELVSIAVDPPDLESQLRQMVRRYRYKFPVLLDQETEVSNRFNPTMDLPFSVLVDRNGRIAAIHQGYKTGDEVSIEKKVSDLLAR